MPKGFKRVAPGVQRGMCPWCKLPVVLDDNRRVSSHQAPTCPRWDALMREAQQKFGPGAARPIGAEVLPWGSDDEPPS